MIIDPRNYPPLMERYVKGQDLAQTPGAVILNEDCPYGLRFVRGHTGTLYTITRRHGCTCRDTLNGARAYRVRDEAGNKFPACKHMIATLLAAGAAPLIFENGD